MYYASDAINLRWLFDLKPEGSMCEDFGLNTLDKSVDLLFAFAQNIALEWIDEAIDLGKVERAIKAAALENVINGNLNQAIMENTLSGGTHTFRKVQYKEPAIAPLALHQDLENKADYQSDRWLANNIFKENLRGYVNGAFISTVLRIVHSVKH